jgi:predicted porin
MKRLMFSVVALAASSVFAQSSVTIFGILDATLAIGNGDISNKTALSNSGSGSSRLGFRGTEDLGGGRTATFWLEGSVNNDNGTGSATNVNNTSTGGALAGMGGSQGFLFNRKSVVTLKGDIGEVVLGRDYTPHFVNLTYYDPFTTNGVGNTRILASGSGGTTQVRASNSIGYHSPTINGFDVWVQTYLGENASSAASQAGDGSSIYGSYNMGPVSLGLAYGKTTTGAGTDLKTTNLGGSYKTSYATLMALYNKDANTGLKDITGYQLGAVVPFGRSTIRVAFSGTDNGTAKTDQFAIRYAYDLSARTSVYSTFASLKNAGGASAALNGAVTSVNGSSTGLDLGVKHTF